MSELPKGWAAATLNDLLGTGGLFSDGDWVESKDQDPDGSNRLLQLADIGDGFFVNKSSRFVNDEKFSSLNCTEVKEGDVLIARMPDPLGRACLMPAMPQRCLTVVDVAVFRAGDTGISNKWLMHFLNSSPVRREIELNSSGTTRKRISRGKLAEIVLPIPPLAEQTRIATKLDELLPQVDTLKARIDGIPALLKRFRQSVLSAAVSGRLTEEWRGKSLSVETGSDVVIKDQMAKQALLEDQPELKKKKSSIQSDIDENYLFEIPENWAFTTWGKISEWITYGFTRPMPKSGAGKKLLTAKDVQRFALELVECGLTTTDAFDTLSDKDRPQNGDLLITKDGSIGRAALVRTEEDFCINQSVAVCWLRSTTMNKSYLELLSNSEFTQRFVLDKAQGMAIQHLSIIDFAKCPVPVPPKSEQNEIVRLVEQLFAFADQLESRIKAAQAHIDHLTQSILAKAFRGELVPQDPNDEPASVLLERIKAQRAAAPKAKRGRRTATLS